MFASDWNTLSRPNNRVVGPNGVLMGSQNGEALPSPSAIANLAAWYDVSDFSRMTIDGSNRVQLIADKSAYSTENCLVLPGVAGNYASTPDSAAVSITGDIDIRANTSLNNWSDVSRILGRYLSASNDRSYVFLVNGNGTLGFIWSSLGTLGSTATVNSTAPTGFSAFSRKWIRVTLDVDNGAGGHDIRFYTSDDGLIWSQLGDTVVGVGATSIYDGVADLWVGSAQGFSSAVLTGNVYRAQIYNGINGTLVFDADFTAQSKLAPSFTESSTNAATVTINATAIALPARIHGERDLYMGTQASQPYYAAWDGENYGYLNGASGAYFSTPDSAAVSVTGDIDMTVCIKLTSWSSSQYIISKVGVANGSRSYAFRVTSSGTLRTLLYPAASGAGVEAESDDPVPFLANETGWCRVTWRQSDGRIQFFTSVDGSSWAQLGADKTIGIASIYDGDGPLEIGGFLAGTQQLVSGRVIQATVKDGIDGTVVASFSPSDYPSSGGSTFVSSATGETWTINGGATIVDRTQIIHDGTNDYLLSAAFPLSQPENIYIAFKHLTWVANDGICDGIASLSGAIYQRGTTPNISIYAGTAAIDVNPALSLQTAGIVSAVINGANSSARSNRGAASTGNAGASNMGGFTFGARGSGVVAANTAISEVLIYDTTAHTTAQQDRLALYFARKWRIPNV